MGLVEKAPKKIVWRAIEYYKQNKILDVKETEPDCYKGEVSGSGSRRIRCLSTRNIRRNPRVHAHLHKKMM